MGHDTLQTLIKSIDSSYLRRLVLHVRQHIPDKDQLTFLVLAYAVCAHPDRGFVTGFASRQLPIDSGQETTLGFKSVHLETCIDQHLAALA